MMDAAPIIPQHVTLGTLEYGDLPESSGVYLVFHKQECLYVGQSRNMRKRWQFHDRRGACRRVSRDLAFAWIAAPMAELRTLERKTVETFLPRLNRQLKPCSMEKTIYTVPEVAQRLQVTDKTVRAWIRDRQLTAIRVGREWRIREEDIQQFIDRHLSTATQEIHGDGD